MLRPPASARRQHKTATSERAAAPDAATWHHASSNADHRPKRQRHPPANPSNAANWRQAMYEAAYWACAERQPHEGRAAECSNRPQARGGCLKHEPAAEPPRQARQPGLMRPAIPTTGPSDNGTRPPTVSNAAIWRQAMYRAAQRACTERQPHEGRAAKCFTTHRTTIARNAAIWPKDAFEALFHDSKITCAQGQYES